LAFRTPETRVSRTEPSANVHSRIIGMTWEGGFLDGMKIRFNDSLNVLIGGRGSGKSTVIESLRYALALKPLTPSSAEDHAGMIKQVLGAGTKVLVAIQVRIPSDAVFTIERLVGSTPVVRDSTGALLQSAPLDLLRGVEIYGQRELAELARNRQQLTSLLAQYLPNGTEDEQVAATNKQTLERSRWAILATEKEIETLDSRLARMFVIRERLKRFEAAGVHEKLHDHEQTQQEELLLERASLSLRSAMAPKAGLTLDTDYLALAGGTPEPPRAQLITRARSILDHYNAAVATALTALNSARAAAEANLVVLRSEWDEETKEIRESLEKVLRELQPDGIDGGEYLRLRSELSDLEPLTQERARRAACLQALISDRESLLVAAEDRRAQRLRALQQEAKKVARGLPNIVRASVRDGEDRKVLTDLLDSHAGSGGRGHCSPRLPQIPA